MAEIMAFEFRNLPLLLLQVREDFMNIFRPALLRNGITEQQWRILRLLYASPAREPREICALTYISSPSLAGMLARMEKQGLVTRHPVDNDRRRQRIELTERARRIVDRMAPAINETYRKLANELGGSLLERLESTLAESHQKFERTDDRGRGKAAPGAAIRRRHRATRPERTAVRAR